MSAPLPIGAMTPFGKVCAILFIATERYYMLLDSAGTVSLMPAVAVEEATNTAKREP